jgi:hypothetical protein
VYVIVAFIIGMLKCFTRDASWMSAKLKLDRRGTVGELWPNGNQSHDAHVLCIVGTRSSLGRKECDNCQRPQQNSLFHMTLALAPAIFPHLQQTGNISLELFSLASLGVN